MKITVIGRKIEVDTKVKDYIEKKGGPMIQMRGCLELEDKSK